MAYAVPHFSSTRSPVRGRLLSVMYIGRVYEKIVKGRDIYSKKRLPIPKPEFFVLYNGTDPFPDQEIYRLSDSFEKLKNLSPEEKDSPALELVVKVININEGGNQVIADRCKKLSEYSVFVAKVRAFFNKLGNKEEAIREAVKYCEKHGILKEFLKLYAAEVLGMLDAEFDMDVALAVRYEEGREEGEENKALEIAMKALAKGSSLEFVHEITGFDMDTLKSLQAGSQL